FLYDITKINTDAKPHFSIFRQFCISACQFFLNRNGTLNCVHNTGELGKHVVTRGASGNLILILFGRFKNAAFHMPFSSENPFLKIYSSDFLPSF
ncbi:MAG: hypothetical protein WBV21_16985, partial [Desulfobacterales bacterium]